MEGGEALFVIQPKSLINKRAANNDNAMYKPLLSLFTIIKLLKSKKTKPINQNKAIINKYDLNNLIF